MRAEPVGAVVALVDVVAGLVIVDVFCESGMAIASVAAFDVDADLLAAAVVAVQTFVDVVTAKLVGDVHLLESLKN